ncbi:AraC family transcriptional regulator [Megamonas hypermegale]|uniref:AraC family transcriptional regulator n=1 Tax=Megamonas hypermegale TaxID=158847 RepID=UPI0026F14C17|nr:helix-turn-helix domain-containing protein [Megamonas hypermegale]
MEQIIDNKKRDGFKGERLIVLPIEVFQDYVNHPQVKRMYLTDIGYFPKAEHHYRERKEGVDQYIFFYCTEGKGVISVDNKEYILQKNEAFCIPRNKGHFYYACDENPWSILWVHIKGEDTKYFPLDECRIIHFSTEASINRMFFLFDLLFRVLDVSYYSLGNFIYISQVLNLIMGETYCREKPKSVSSENRQVTYIVRFMYKNLDKNLTLKQILDEFKCSKSHLNDIFQKATQHSPMDFYINLKVQEACKLLRSTDLLIYEVAERLGYKDQYYFSRTFKKITGMSPSDYRNK